MNFYEARNEILQTPRYDSLMGRRTDLGEQISVWFSEMLEQLFSNFYINIDPSRTNYNLEMISLAFVIVAVVLLIVAGVVAFRTLRNSRTTQYHDLMDIFEEVVKKNYSVSDLIQLSQNAPDRRLAIRYRYIAVLLALNEKQIIEIKPSATNATILRQIQAASPMLSLHFSYLVDVFHRAWFGSKDITDEAYKKLTESAAVLLNYKNGNGNENGNGDNIA